MAIIATLESFFRDSEGNGGGEKFAGGGEGEGEVGGSTGGQGFRGRPHKKEFPTNEELGKFLREDGIEPLR